MHSRSTALLLALALVLSPQVYAAKWFKTVAEAKAEAKKKNQIIFVDLFAQWCGWCHRMEREVFPAEAFQKATKDMVLLRVDTEDRGEGTKLAREYEVTKLPTFLMIASDGLLIGIIYGYAPAEQFVKRIAEVEGKYKAFLKEVAAEPTFKADHKRRLGLAIDFITRRGYAQAEPRLLALTTEKAVPADIAAKAYHYLALAQYSTKRVPEAMNTLKILFGKYPGGEGVERGKLLLGQIYYEQGNYVAALNELRAFKKNYPSSAMISTVDSLIPMVENAVARR